MKIRDAIILVALMAAAPARAQQAGDLRQSRVSYTDINTASDAGMLVLRRRIKAASRMLCGPEPDLRDLDRGVQYRTCIQESLQRALDQLPGGSLASR